MYLEEICLSAVESESEADQPVAKPEPVAVLEQTNGLRRAHSAYTLYDNHRVSVKSGGVMQKSHDYTLDVRVLDPEPRRCLKICWRQLLAGVALAAAAGGAAFAEFAPGAPLLMLAFSTGAAACLTLGAYQSYDRVVFYSQCGRVPLVVLFNRLPDRRALAAFTDALTQDITATKKRSRSPTETLSEELKEHRRLMEEGVISARRYDIAKQRILGQHGAGQPGTQ